MTGKSARTVESSVADVKRSWVASATGVNMGPLDGKGRTRWFVQDFSVFAGLVPARLCGYVLFSHRVGRNLEVAITPRICRTPARSCGQDVPPRPCGGAADTAGISDRPVRRAA